MLTKDLLLSSVGNDAISFGNDDPLTFEKEVIYVDNFKKWDSDGNLIAQWDIDESDIDHWVKTHEELISAGIEVPMPVKHTDDPEAKRATALKYVKKPDSKGRTALFVQGRFRDAEAKKNLATSNVSLYSPKILRHQDKVFVSPITHICFTDYPVVADTDPLTIAASNEPMRKKPMKLAALAAALGLQVAADATDDVIGAQIEESYKTLKTEAAKPPVETTKTVTIAASNDSPDLTKKVNALELSNRSLKIDKLLTERRITTAEHKTLTAKFCDAAIALSNDVEMSFSTVMEIMGSREPIKALAGEQTGGQVKPAGADNPLVKLTQKMGGKAS